MLKCLPEEEEQIAKDLFTVNSKADTVQALVQHQNEGFIMTIGQSKLLYQAGQNSVLSQSTDGVPKTPAQALVDWMQEQDNLTYIILKDKDSKLIHIWKPSKCLLHEMEAWHLCNTPQKHMYICPQNVDTL